jgi:hypothetical protein
MVFQNSGIGMNMKYAHAAHTLVGMKQVLSMSSYKGRYEIILYEISADVHIDNDDSISESPPPLPQPIGPIHLCDGGHGMGSHHSIPRL